MTRRKMKYIHWRLACIAMVGLACAKSDRPATRRMRQVAQARCQQAGVCMTPAQGIVIAPDSIASLPTRAPLSELKRRCAVGDTTLYDEAVGWQAMAWVFPFTGGRLLAVQSKHGFGDDLSDSEPADLWTA